MKKILLIICAALLISGCGENSQAQEVKTLNTIKISISDKTFTANFTPINYSITYNLDGGTNNSDNPATRQMSHPQKAGS